MTEEYPTIARRGAAVKYDWGHLKSHGWMFVPIEDGHKSQPCSIRAAARHHGLRVSAIRAELLGSAGYLVRVR
jgi:hypothetical protein